MEKSTKTSDEIERASTVSTIDDFDNCSTQDACDFEQHFNNVSSGDDDADTTDTTDTIDTGSTLPKLKITNFFKVLNPPSILSPVSELALNIAKTKLFPDNGINVTGK